MTDATQGRESARQVYFDRRDSAFVIGLFLVGAGCGMMLPAAGLVVPGAILVAVAVFGVRG